MLRDEQLQQLYVLEQSQPGFFKQCYDVFNNTVISHLQKLAAAIR
jgi:hypothetical protein